MASDNNNIVLVDKSNDVQNSENMSPMQSSMTSLLPILLIFMVFYFLLIRPQEKKRREHEKLISTVKRGEEVVTQAGIYGVVSKVTESSETVEITIAKDVDIKILKSSITNIIGRKDLINSDKTEVKSTSKAASSKKDNVETTLKKVTKKSKA